MSIDYLTQLTDQAKAFVLTASGSANPLTPEFTLSPPASLIKPAGGPPVTNHALPPRLALAPVDTVLEPVEVGSKVTTVDLPLVGRWVRLPGLEPTSNPGDEDPIGGMPVAEQVPQVTGDLTGLTTGLNGTIRTALTTAVPPEGLMLSEAGQTLVPGVPALVGRVAGTVTEVVNELKEVLRALEPIDVSAQIRINVVDEQDPASTVVTSQVSISVDGGTTWGQLTGAPIVIGTTPLTFRLQLPALVSDLTETPPVQISLSVRVSVDLEVTPAALGNPIRATFDLPPVPLLLPTIPVPTLVVLCEHPNFLGRKLVVVPSGSLLGQAVSAGGRPLSDTIALTNQVLGTLRAALSGAAGLIAFGDFLLGAQPAALASPAVAATVPAAAAAGMLTTLADAPGQTLIVAGSNLTTLDAPGMVFYEGWGPFSFGRFTGNHMASSLLVVGRPGTTVSFRQQAGLFKGDITPLTVTLGAQQYACAISDLEAPGATVNIPRSSPASRMSVAFGGSVTGFSPKNNEDQVCGVAIAKAAPGLAPAT